MTVVYLDELFLLNFVVNYLLLLAGARLAGEVLRRRRLAAGGALGALYACAVFLPGMGFLLHPLCKLGSAVLMALLAYGGSKRLLRLFLVFAALACAFGGGILAIGLLGGRGLTLKNGILYSGMDLKLILLSAAGCYAAITLLFSRAARHGGMGQRDILAARLKLEGREMTLPTLVDTGNTLTDPITGQPVMVAEGHRLAPILPGGRVFSEAELKSPADTLEQLAQSVGGRRFRLLPYRAVGVQCGMLLALRMDSVQVGERDYGGILVALSPTPVSDGGGYGALIGT